MAEVQRVSRARDAFERRQWTESCRLLEEADREAPLTPDDLERLATAAYLIGRDDQSEGARARAHQGYLERGDPEGAARSAFWLAFGLATRGAAAPASGWLARAERVLDEAAIESVVRGYLLIPAAIQRVVQGDPAAGHSVFTTAAVIASRFADRELASLAANGRGRALIRLGNIAEGVALLDEAMVAVLAGDVSPILAGDIYCSVLEACQELFDLRRAYEWTVSLTQWCAEQPDLVRYRGECLLYRAEIMQLRGRWIDAAHDAIHACELLSADRRPAAGAAFYRLGEIHRIRGELTKAEAAYRRANEYGRTPQPGLALLRLAQNQIDVASASIRNALSDSRERRRRANLLGPAVEVLLAAGDQEGARAAAAELADIAAALNAATLSAESARATGAILLAGGDAARASVSLRRACELCRAIELPYEEAHARVLLATAYRALGDHDGAQIEVDSAGRLFRRLGAQPALTRVAEVSRRRPHLPAGLSEREAQVLRLIAAGKTNRAIGEQLFISEKTVARHVSNIFTKVGVSTRAGATAWAYDRHLV